MGVIKQYEFPIKDGFQPDVKMGLFTIYDSGHVTLTLKSQHSSMWGHEIPLDADELKEILKKMQ